jgi:hypothetical protein
MEGKDLYKELIAKRDYSGSEADEYAQLLITLFSHIGNSFFSLLESAHLENKKLSIKESDSENDILVDEYTLENIVIL